MTDMLDIGPHAVRDVDFNLFEVLGTEGLFERPTYEHVDKAVCDEMLGTAFKIARDRFLNHYVQSDRNPPALESGTVVTLPETKEAIRQFIDGGFLLASVSMDNGGLQLPFSVVQACYAFFQAANVATTSYCFLTAAAGNVIRNFGSPIQKERFLAPMEDGRFLGTMCLSEPQAGSALADVRTRAIRQPDGTYRIKGTKMWISAGEHEMSENIVHLVLARAEGAPAGVKGISMFIVPKRRLSESGSSGESNDVTLVGLNHKMGWRGVTNTVLNFGEKDDCHGYLVGQENRGLEYMFQMMNEARISVGLGATMTAYAGFRYSLAYARTRPQGRMPSAKDPSSKPVMISEHADVRRMLLTQKVFAEGALSLCLYAARLVDDTISASDDADRENAHRILDLLTPIVKSWPSEFCLEANKLAIQVLGGYGYTTDYPVEQLYRDNRLNAIHEGTNGIQSIDLLGRKIRGDRAASLDLLGARIIADIDRAGGDPRLERYGQALRRKYTDIRGATRAAIDVANDDITLFLSNASAYCDLLGHLVIGWMWLRQGIAAAEGLDRGSAMSDGAFYRAKLAAMHHFYLFEIDRIDHWLSVFSSMDRSLVDLDVDAL